MVYYIILIFFFVCHTVDIMDFCQSILLNQMYAEWELFITNWPLFMNIWSWNVYKDIVARLIIKSFGLCVVLCILYETYIYDK